MNIALYKYRLLLPAVLLLAALQMHSCKSKKKAVVKPEIVLNKEEILLKLDNSRFEFQSLSFHFKGKFEQAGKKSPIAGQIRMQKDSLIWVSISPVLGIEIARILISPHQIKYYNKWEKTAFEQDLSYIKRQLHSALDFSLLQSVLIGNDFENYENRNFEFRQTSTDFILRNENRQHKYTGQRIPFQEIKLEKSLGKINEMSIDAGKGENNRIRLQYGDFETIASQNISHYIFMEILASQDMKIEIERSHLKWNTSLRFPFKIPEDYQIIK